MGRLAGKVALVTGAGTGIGQALAVRFGREGAAPTTSAVWTSWSTTRASPRGGPFLDYTEAQP